MNLADLAAVPQLKKLVLDDEQVVTKYGEPIEFYIHDRIPLDEYMSLMTSMSGDSNDHTQMLIFAKALMLDEKGKQILTGKKVLPGDIAMLAIQKVSAELGNL